MNVNPLNGIVPAEQLAMESIEDKYTGIVLEVLSSPPSSSRDCFSKFVHYPVEDPVGKELDLYHSEKLRMKNAVGVFRELLVGRRVSPHSLKILKEERTNQFVEFIEVFREKFKCDPPFRTFFKPPLDFLADKALIVACCQRLIDQLRDDEEHIRNFFAEHNLEGLRTYLLKSRELIENFNFISEMKKYMKIIESYHQLDGLIQDNKPRIDQLRNLKGRLSGFLNQLTRFMSWGYETDLDPETVINQIGNLQHRLRDIKELAIDLDEDRPIPPLQDMCIDVVLKGRIDLLPYGFFSSLVRCSLDCAIKELIGTGEYSCGYLHSRCVKNAVDIFCRLLRIFPQSEERRRLGQFIIFIKAFRKKFERDPPLKFSSTPLLDFLANKALIVGSCQRHIDQLHDFKEQASNFSQERDRGRLKTYLLGLKQPQIEWEWKTTIREYIEIIKSKLGIDQLRNLEGRLSGLFNQLKGFAPCIYERGLDSETVINQIQDQIGDLQHRLREIKELIIDPDRVYPPKEGLRERSLEVGSGVANRFPWTDLC